MTEERTAIPSMPAESLRGIPALLRRRRFVVDPRYQFRASLMMGALVLVLLALLNVSLFVADVQGRRAALAAAPELGDLLRSQDRLELALVAAISVVFLIGVVVVGLLETHRTAGAAFVLRRGLGDVAEGRFAIRLKLRKGDNLQALAEAFNHAASSLHERTLAEIEELERLAERAGSLGRPEALEIAAGLRTLAAAKRRFSP